MECSPEIIVASKPLQKRFYFHTLCGILFPLTFFAYYVWTYTYWLRHGSNHAEVNKSIPNGLYVWWSWFFIGAIGINISDFSLAGVEAAMMMGDRFKPKTQAQLSMQRDKTWSTLQAWSIVSKEIYRSVSRRSMPRLSKLWFLLFTISILSWTFVLSGLSMETYAGFKAGTTAGADVVGINYLTMNNRPGLKFMERTTDQWITRAAPQIPLGSALYVRPQSNITVNVSSTNTLPQDGSSEMFLASQADPPVTGRSWGLILKYNCTEIHRLDQFSILSRRLNSKSSDYLGQSWDNSSDLGYFYTLDDGSSVATLSQYASGGMTNIIGFAEIGMSTGYGSILEQTKTWGYSRTCLTCGDGIFVPSYSGLGEEEVLEFALWQGFNNPPGTEGDFIGVKDSIPELQNEHFQPQDPYGETGRAWDGSMSAIGVRCTSSSVTGNAKVNGLAGTFTEFERLDPASQHSIPPNILRLGLGVPMMLFPVNESTKEPFLNYGSMLDPLATFVNGSTNYTIVSSRYNWLEPLLAASNNLNLSSTAQQLAYYDTLIQTPNLKRTIASAYQQYAIQLMFQGASTISDAWYNPNITVAEPWILIRASTTGVPPLFILVTMLLWTMGCVLLSLAYGFRLRWAETFDDQFLLRFNRDPRNANLGLESVDFLYSVVGSEK